MGRVCSTHRVDEFTKTFSFNTRREETTRETMALMGNLRIS